MDSPCLPDKETFRSYHYEYIFCLQLVGNSFTCTLHCNSETLLYYNK